MIARPCKYCGNPVAPTTEKCPSCGGTEPFPLTPAEFGKGALLAVGIFVVLLLTCVSALWFADSRQPQPSSRPTAPELRAGTIAMFDGPRLVYATIEDHVEFSHRRNASLDTYDMLGPKVFMVDDSTRCRVGKRTFVDMRGVEGFGFGDGRYLIEVEILDGPHVGRTGVALQRHVKPTH